MNISVQHLGKTYGKNGRALEDVTFEIENGMFGLLGPNGAGKTTLMRILVTLMKPTEGRVLVNGLDLQRHRREIRAMLGYLPQEFRFFAKLTTWEFLDYVAALAGLRDARRRSRAVGEMLEQVGLYDVRDRMANKLSGGMKRRLGIAQALIGEPVTVAWPEVDDEPPPEDGPAAIVTWSDPGLGGTQMRVLRERVRAGGGLVYVVGAGEANIQRARALLGPLDVNVEEADGGSGYASWAEHPLTAGAAAIGAVTPGATVSGVGGSPLAQVNGVFNAIWVVGDACDQVMLYGRGAGALPTGSAVAGDVLDCARNIIAGTRSRVPCTCAGAAQIMPIDEVRARTYVRMRVKDRPGVLGSIATIFGQEGVSIASVVQRDAMGELAEIVWIMHEGEQRNLRSALGAIGQLGIVDEVCSVIRVVE